MRNFKKSYLYIFFVFASFMITEAKAQVFGNEGRSSQTTESSNTPSAANSWFANPRATATPKTTETTATKAEKKEEDSKAQNWTQPKKDEQPYTPQYRRPTLDGVKRGHTSMVPIVSDEEKNKVDDRYIFVYYSNFNIRTTMSGTLMCDVRFIVLSTLDRRINNLSFRLKWPAMETGLNFEGVTPNTETYYDYTLLGEGCYSMDKIPNIIVNRCRVKGLSSQDCANRIKWLRKQ